MTHTALSSLPPILMMLAGVMHLSCNDDRSADLRGQTNTTLTFYGKVVEQDGKPLPDATFEMRVEAYPKNWTFETRGRDNDVSTVTAISDQAGRFQFTVTGCRLIRTKAQRSGYRILDELDKQDGTQKTSHYGLIAWSDVLYKSDSEHPAVYVFVKDGVNEVSALPCRGGWDSGGGKQWTLNQPAWPKQPSLKDVIYKPPTTMPATKP